MRPRSSPSALLASLLFVLAVPAAGPLAAGTVYVPLGIDAASSGLALRTRVLVSNSDPAVSHRVSIRFIPTVTDGTLLVPAPSEQLVAPLTMPPTGGHGEPVVENANDAVIVRAPGVFHVPTPAEPTWVFNIPVPENHRFRTILVEMDVTHLRYRFDPGQGRFELLVTQGGVEITRIEGPSIVNAAWTDGSGFFMIYCGHEDSRAFGPEVPTYGWQYADLRIEFKS